MIDYQIQTTASDGKFTPRECVKMARENGLRSIAITDHDTVAGVEEGLKAGEEFGVEVIPGIELSCSYQDRMIHVLGFGIDYQNAKLLLRLHEAKEYRKSRARRIVERLSEFGFSVDYEKVKARAEGVVTRPHIAAEVMENPENAERLGKEEIRTKRDFLDKYIGEGGKVPVPPEQLSPQDAIEMVHSAGGVAVWSHPTWPSSNKDFIWIEETLRVFISWGLDGIEVLLHGTESEVVFLHNLAGKYAMVKTAGSDFHDVYEDPETRVTCKVGGYPTYGYTIAGIRESLLAAIEKRKSAVASLSSS
ncbi:MAG: PHP domain-containing protein [Candidatus Sungbacteria bacterium]|nr:PHP domain-containing protein [Candidatus Sungbacteria bacterium]